MKLKVGRACKWVAVGLLAFLLWALLPILSNLGGANAGETTSALGKEPRITEVRAFLYYQGKGEFSRQDLLSGYMVLRNVIIGEGDAEAPSAAMLVLVTVGPPVRVDRDIPFLKLTVKYAKGTAFNQEVSLGPFSNLKSPIKVPFVIYNTGCERLEIVAVLRIGSRRLGSLSRTAEFKCGE